MALDTPNPAQARGAFYVKLFDDDRANADMGRTYFGTIRGGYGNPLERLHFSSPASEVVQSTTITVLRSLGYRADRPPVSPEVSDPSAKILTGRILELYASNNAWTSKRYVHAQLEVCLSSGKWCRSVRGSDEDAQLAGMSGNTPIMDAWLRRLLEDRLVAFFSTPEFAGGLKDVEPVAQDPRDRLKQLQQLLSEGLISKEEYEARRKQIVDGL